MTVPTSAYYCHSCAVAGSMIEPLPSPFTATGSKQPAKEEKHTVATYARGYLGVFTTTDSQGYWDYIVEPMAAGCVEIDARGRKNIILVGSENVGITFHNGAYVGPANAIKVVLTADSSTIHPIPLPASLLNVGSCAQCGVRVPY